MDNFFVIVFLLAIFSIMIWAMEADRPDIPENEENLIYLDIDSMLVDKCDFLLFRQSVF